MLTMPGGANVMFENNALLTSRRVDERNLLFCHYLNLRQSSIISLETTHLRNLRGLILNWTAIDTLNTIPLINLVILKAIHTRLTVLDTTNLGML